MAKIKAVALVGFYRGDLVEPGTILELDTAEFGELRSYHKVDFAPQPEAKGASSASVGVEVGVGKKK